MMDNEYFNYVEFCYEMKKAEEYCLEDVIEIEMFPFEAFWKSAVMGVVIFY